MKKLLYYSPASYGGIADYAHEQANALVAQGWNVTLLSTPNYPTGRNEQYQIVSILEEFKSSQTIPNKIVKAIDFLRVTLSNIRKLANFIENNRFQYVLLGSYTEYFAPFWSGCLQKLANKGVVFGAIVHDPIRNFVVGPRWWHRRSIACGYSFLREAFVHEAISLDTVKPIPQLNTTIIPFGVYSFPSPETSKAAMRAKLNLPLDAKVMLAFGHIRDSKNLDLVIRAMVKFPQLYLIVAGKEQSSGQKPTSFYQNLAQTLGVGDRCRWEIRFLADLEVANLFEASDLAILTYSKTFHSASSALSIATNYRKLCLASAGKSSLQSIVQKYKLGIWIEPDSLDAVIDGIEQWLEEPPLAQWERYFAENAWAMNARLVGNQFTNLQPTLKMENISCLTQS
jgi:glycosyltransferase involved in cell wall biosynthesis